MPPDRCEFDTLPALARTFAACILSLSILLLAACGGGTSSTPPTGGTAPPPTTPPPTTPPPTTPPPTTPPPTSTTLAASVSTLALSTAGLTEYGIAGTPASGLSRSITITNTGAVTASALTVVPAAALPSGTAMTTTCGSLLAAGASCTVSFTPGATATSDGTNPCTAGTAPVPAAVSVSGSNTNTVSTDVVVLGYGCIDQGGYVYAFDDTTPASASVGGKVLTTSDQSTGIRWAANGSSGVANDAIYGITEVSTSSSPDPTAGQVAGQSACNGATDGACDTNNLYLYYQNDATNAPIPLSQYAAGACKATIGGYSDWYLPAVCEMGYGNPACGSSGAPTLQNAQSDLVDASGLSLSGFYWSSTEYSANPQAIAWLQYFATGGGSAQFSATKSNLLSVRCSRAF
ncbi:DUF1566 domain-containing protein [Thiomonas sp. FB-6]|uniref:DUF1566 domain-containing protein n=1 Tax=Thiomonas sp. FB-6 TaxID=1158291 RepID=UPI00039E6A37|nr:DUF1566 domain-containing protein [Thiomonas sp. FB-6]